MALSVYCQAYCTSTLYKQQMQQHEENIANLQEVEKTQDGKGTIFAIFGRGDHVFNNGELTEHEFVNACFSVAEQVSEIQANLLSAAIEVATGGTSQPHLGTGGGGSTSELPWRDKDKNLKTRTAIKRC